MSHVGQRDNHHVLRRVRHEDRWPDQRKHRPGHNLLPVLVKNLMREKGKKGKRWVRDK